MVSVVGVGSISTWMRRLQLCVLAVATIAFAAWWSLYRDQSGPRPIDGDVLASLDLSARAALIADQAVESGAPGAIVLLRSRGDQAVATAGSTSRARGARIDPDTPLRIASVSKLYTAAVLVDLSRRGLIDLDTKIDAYLPAPMIADLPNGKTVTVRQLLNHSAGIPDYLDLRHYLFGDWTVELSMERALRASKRQAAPFLPGERTRYSNMGYLLAGAIAEQVTEQTFSSLIDEVLVEPLGLSATYYGVHSPPGADLHGYGTKLRPWADAFVFWQHAGPDAGIMASASDVAQVLDALVLHDERLNGLGSAMLEQPIGHPGHFERALGFVIRRSGSGLPIIGHRGDVPGYLTFAHAVPEVEGVVVGHITCDCPALLSVMADQAVQAVALAQTP
ncbi:MAG: serine hydrolase domain-containing protein [Pseudomonadota bacterium]